MSSNTHTPDRWVIIRINTPEYGTIDKILCSWAGSYLYGSSWKLSSGMLTFEEDAESYTSKQDSGSAYILRKTSEGMSSIMSGVYHNFVEQVQNLEGSIEIIASKDYKGVNND